MDTQIRRKEVATQCDEEDIYLCNNCFAWNDYKDGYKCILCGTDNTPVPGQEFFDNIEREAN